MKGKKSKAGKAPIPAPAPAPPPPPAEVFPDLEGCSLSLDWRDFKSLLEASSASAAPPPAGELSPDRYLLGAVRLEGEVGERAAKVKASLSLDVLGSGWVFVPLIAGELAMREVTFADKPVALLEHSGRQGVLIEGPCRGPLSCSLDLPLLVEAAQSGLRFGFPGAPALELSLRVPGEQELDVHVEPAVRSDARREGKATLVSASVPAGDEVVVSWTVSVPEDKAKPAVDPVLQAYVETLALVGDGSLRLRTHVHLDVLRAPVREFELAVPAGLTITDVRAPRLAQWDADGEGRVSVLLEQAVEGGLRFELDADRQLDESGEAPLAAPRLLGATRDQGHVAVAASTNVDVAALEVSGARRVDARELPERLTARAGRTVVHSFHYAGTEPSLTIRATKHPELPVITTVVDRAHFLVMVTEDGQRYVQARYTVRNAQRQFLRVALGADEELLSALRDNEPVKPVQGEEDHVLVPLRRATTPEEADDAFTVEVVTRTPQDPLGERGQLGCRLPTVELPVAYLTCELHLPLGFVYDDFTGTLHEVDAFADPIVRRSELLARLAQEQARKPKPAPRRSAAKAKKMAPPAPQRAMQQREAQMEMDDAFACAEEMVCDQEILVGASANFDANFGAGGMAMPSSLVDEGETGRLPIRIDIPEQGERFRFERILCLGEPLDVSTEYTREKR